MIQLIDFYADWCGPCLAMKPIFEEAEKLYGGKVEFKRVDVEDDTSMAQKYGVMSIPTFVILKDGEEVARRMGAMPKDVLTSWIDSNL
jgi:thioredoxin 1